MDFGGQTGIEVGWAIAADRWREGLASEAAARVVEIGFDDCGLDEIVSFTMVENVASRGVMEKFGFRLRRRRRACGAAARAVPARSQDVGAASVGEYAAPADTVDGSGHALRDRR